VEVHYNPEQTCCGQPAFNSGHWDEARMLAVKFMNDFEDARIIVGPSASCTGYIKNTTAGCLPETNDLLVRFEHLQPWYTSCPTFWSMYCRKRLLDAIFPHKVTYHDACSALREYGIRSEPRLLLSKVKGLELVEMKDTETCCGFGGTFAAKFIHISTAMTAQKVEHAMASRCRIYCVNRSIVPAEYGKLHQKKKLPSKRFTWQIFWLKIPEAGAVWYTGHPEPAVHRGCRFQ
jgi:L-lactate dehydrogenase complex protein LldE